MAQPEQQTTYMPLPVLEINRLRDRMTEAERELAAAEKLVQQKRAEVAYLHQQWRDTGLLGR